MEDPRESVGFRGDHPARRFKLRMSREQLPPIRRLAGLIGGHVAIEDRGQLAV